MRKRENISQLQRKRKAVDPKTYQKQIRQIGLLLKCSGLLNNRDLSVDRSSILDVMTSPLEKRFQYHFFLEQKTNDLSKPEWFFTQILNWINANIDFISALWRQISRHKDEQTEMLNLYVEKLLWLTRKKVRSTASKVINNVELFSHLIDECVAFENELQ
ncbi:unnamed protein product, partial [Gongylonema pulchrum]|uniref:DDE_Tnp_ISL3 domain-containing protein n=1 Tax=Gongylonema pulchrum TaxID=637853 RepID=A0A183E8I5_9BILA